MSNAENINWEIKTRNGMKQFFGVPETDSELFSTGDPTRELVGTGGIRELQELRNKCLQLCPYFHKPCSPSVQSNQVPGMGYEFVVRVLHLDQIENAPDHCPIKSIDNSNQEP